MKPLRLVILLWLAVASLLVGLCQQESVAAANLQPRAVFSLHPRLAPTPPPPPAALAAKAPVRDGARAGPFASPAAPLLLCPERDGPPSWETRGPPGPVQAAWSQRFGCRRGRQPKETEPPPNFYVNGVAEP